MSGSFSSGALPQRATSAPCVPWRLPALSRGPNFFDPFSSLPNKRLYRPIKLTPIKLTRRVRKGSRNGILQFCTRRRPLTRYASGIFVSVALKALVLRTVLIFHWPGAAGTPAPTPALVPAEQEGKSDSTIATIMTAWQFT